MTDAENAAHEPRLALTSHWIVLAFLEASYTIPIRLMRMKLRLSPNDIGRNELVPRTPGGVFG